MRKECGQKSDYSERGVEQFRSFFVRVGCYSAPIPDDRNALSPAAAEDVASALVFALRFQGRKRVHNADELMSEIVAKRLVEHLERAGFVVMTKPPLGFPGFRSEAQRA